MKKYFLIKVMAAIIAVNIGWTLSAQACSEQLIDQWAARIDGSTPESSQIMKTAVTVAKTCDLNLKIRAAANFARKIDGTWSYSARLSQELAKLCAREPSCALTLVSAMAHRIDGTWRYSYWIAQSIKSVVVNNPYTPVRDRAIEGISEAVDPSWTHYANALYRTINEIAEIKVDENSY